MKILFVNPPVIRIENSNKENDFNIDKVIFYHFLQKISGLKRICRFLGLIKGIRYGVRAGSRWPWTSDKHIPPLHYPFIMCYAISYLKKHGIDADIIDSIAEQDYNYKKFLKKVKKKKPDIVVLETSTPTFDIDIWIAEKISKFSKICLAGPHITNEAQNIKRKYPFINFLLKGEYIKSSLKMVKTLREGIYEIDVVEDLDSIPFPYRHFPEAVKYFDPSMPTPRPQLQIYASKGCPFKCIFCLWPATMYKNKVTYRKPEKILEEIKYCVRKYNYKSIFFDDDTFNIGNNRISNLCDGLKKIGLPWTMMGRLDCSSQWLFDKMIECGCVGMRFGIETFNMKVLKNINKGIQSDKIIEILTYLSKNYPDLMLHVTLMKNLPGQTEEIHKKDIEILHKLGFSNNNIKRTYQISFCAPFPGTALYKKLKEKGILNLENWKLYDGSQKMFDITNI